MTIGDRIRTQRELIGISQTELAKKTKISKQTLYKYEMNIISNIPSDKLERISKILDVSPAYLMGWSETTGYELPKESNDVTLSEFEHIKKYRDLDPHGKKMVDFTLNEEWERSTATHQSEAAESIHKASMRLINYYYRLASAGTGQIIFDMPPTKRIEIPNIPEYRKVDYAIGVNGNSMEPAFHDGDMLLIEMADAIEPGEIGIFMVDNESYVKKLGKEELISLNPEYDNIPLTENSKCMGRVIDKLIHS